MITIERSVRNCLTKTNFDRNFLSETSTIVEKMFGDFARPATLTWENSPAVISAPTHQQFSNKATLLGF